MTDSKDWTGNKASVYKTLAASNHSSSEREKNDFYATDPKALDLLLEKEKFSDLIWEPACGQGHLSKRLEQNGYEVLSTDLIDRGFGIAGVNFLNQGSAPAGCDIITNPPYKFAVDFTIRALNLLEPGHKLALFLKIQFLEGKERKKLFLNFPPKKIYVSSSRLKCAINGGMSNFTCPTCGLTNIDCGKAGYKTAREIELEKKLEIAVQALKWIEEQADTSTQYDYDAEVILKNIVFDAQQALKEQE